jgi:hypothetical protein
MRDRRSPGKACPKPPESMDDKLRLSGWLLCDFHTRNHLYSWKTLVECPKNTQAIKQAIRDNVRIALYLLCDKQKGNKGH